jgi:hypothetical protein
MNYVLKSLRGRHLRGTLGRMQSKMAEDQISVNRVT